jgi:hypothetical protein
MAVSKFAVALAAMAAATTGVAAQEVECTGDFAAAVQQDRAAFVPPTDLYAAYPAPAAIAAPTNLTSTSYVLSRFEFIHPCMYGGQSLMLTRARIPFIPP